MLQFPAEGPDDRALIEKLRASADSIEPPPSLSPEKIRERLPDRVTIPLSRRIAPFAAMAACLAVVLTGVRLFQPSNDAALPTASSQAAIQEICTGNAEKTAPAPLSDDKTTAVFRSDEQNYSLIYHALTNAPMTCENAETGLDSNAKTEKASLNGVTFSLTAEGSLALSRDGTESTLPLYNPKGWTWTPSCLLIDEASARLVVLGEGNSDASISCTLAAFYDVSNPEAPVFSHFTAQNGTAFEAVIADGALLMQSSWIPEAPGDGSNPAAFVPAVWQDETENLFLPEELLLRQEDLHRGYQILTAVNLSTGELQSRLAYCGPLTGAPLSESGTEWNGMQITFQNGTLSAEW